MKNESKLEYTSYLKIQESRSVNYKNFEENKIN